MHENGKEHGLSNVVIPYVMLRNNETLLNLVADMRQNRC